MTGQKEGFDETDSGPLGLGAGKSGGAASSCKAFESCPAPFYLLILVLVGRPLTSESSLRDLSNEPIRDLQIVPVLHQHVVISFNPHIWQLNQSCMATGSVDCIHVVRAKCQTR